MEKRDYKKEFKELYQPKGKPAVIDVPPMTFLMVDGQGDPNEENGAYRQAVGLLYALTFTIKMSKMGGRAPEGYFDYVVPPLEGLWQCEGGGMVDYQHKELFCFTSMIRQPEFVTPAVFQWACEECAKKKPELAARIPMVRRETFTEGLCVQMMHHGPYDDEPASIAQMETFILENGLKNAIGDTNESGQVRRHHEIYLSDPRKAAPEKWRTVLRCPVKR